MRILRVRVDDFGPLHGIDLELDPGLNVIFGGNEAGKTTLLDFLLGHLFRWERRRGTRLATVMGDMDRFGDPGSAAGRVEVGMADGEVLTYPDAPSLLRRLELEHVGLAGLFCVRSGELRFPEKEEGEFWSELKKVLSGAPRGVEALKEAAHARARLTPTGERSDRGSPGPKTRHAELEERIARLEELEGRLPETGRYEEEIARLELALEAQKRARTARIGELWEELREARRARDDLPEIPGEKLARWREITSERKVLAGSREERESEIGGLRGELDGHREVREEAKRMWEELDRRVRIVEERGLAERALVLSRSAAPAPGLAAKIAYRGGAVLAGIAIAFAFFTPSALLASWEILLLEALALAGGALAYFWGKKRHAAGERRAAEREELRKRAADCGVRVEAVDEIPAAVGRLETSRQEARGELQLAAQAVSQAEKRLEKEEDDLASARQKIEALTSEAERLKEELGHESLEDAEAARAEREAAAARAARLESSLEALAGDDPEHWKAAAARAAALAPEEAPPPWDPEEKTRLEEELAGARAGYRELRDAFLRADLSAPDDVLTELRSCREEVRELERDWEAGRIAGSIFQGMDRALEERLDRALERDGEFSVAEMLSRITRRYAGVRRDGPDGLRIHDEGGRTFSPADLSRGTRDQVFFSLRVGLAGAALSAVESEDGGFFLLDDAFLTADWTRRERLVEMSARLAEGGWQVVYLTCDDHLRDLFTDAGARLHELAGKGV